MYDDGPPDPEPNPCPYGDDEHELGTGDGCQHCTQAQRLSRAEYGLANLKHSLASRARQLANLPALHVAGSAARPRIFEGIAVILELAGLKLPDEFLRHAHATMVGEYGDSPPYGVTDDEIVANFMAWAHAVAVADEGSGRFTGDVLEARPLTYADQIWFMDGADGDVQVCTNAERLLDRDRLGGGAVGWGSTLREAIAGGLKRQAGHGAFWCEFFGEYLRPPAGPLVQKDPHVFGGDSTPRISYVVGVQAYTALVGNWDTMGRAGLGFGGAAFTVRLDDGREFFTNNNWSRGTVPVRLRKLMPSNAVFVRRPEAGTAEE